MPMIDVTEADAHDCPFNNFEPCRGPRCMAWLWHGQPFDHAETDNLVDTEDGQRPLGTPPAPDGDGWETDGPPYQKGYHRSEKNKLPKAIAQRWKRPRKVSTGSCGRTSVSPYDHF